MNRKQAFIQAVKSAVAALFGVQSSDQHKQDFDSQTPFPFILAGVIVLVSFVLILSAIVSVVVAE